MINHDDVGCWIIKGNPNAWDYFTALQENKTSALKRHVYPNDWTLGKTYRNQLVQKGDLIALWITGQKNPGIYEFGWVTSDEAYHVDGWDDTYALDLARADQSGWAVEFAAVRLEDNYLPRATMRADAILSGCEPFRAPQVSNPSYLNPMETKALAQLLAIRVPQSHLEAANWGHLL